MKGAKKMFSKSIILVGVLTISSFWATPGNADCPDREVLKFAFEGLDNAQDDPLAAGFAETILESALIYNSTDEGRAAAGYPNSIGAPRHNMTPHSLVYLAAYEGCVSVLQYYVKRYGKSYFSLLKSTRSGGIFPISIRGGNGEIVQFLLDNDVNPLEKFHVALIYENEQVLKSVNALEYSTMFGTQEITDIISRHLNQ